jgi:hypothetical protein
VQICGTGSRIVVDDAVVGIQGHDATDDKLSGRELLVPASVEKIV